MVQCYFEDLLKNHDPFAWCVVKSEWTTSAAVYLLDQARHESKMWLYPRTLRAWIQRLGVKAICQGPAGYDGSAGRDLSALLTLGDQLATVAGLMSRLSRLDPGRRDRTSWIQVRFETVDGVWAAVVDEDLFPLALPYSSDIVESRDILGVPGADSDPGAERGPLGLREVHAGESSGSPSRRDQPGPTRSILVANLLSHGDVPDGDLAAMNQTLTPVQVIGLRGFIGGPVDTLTRAHVGPVLSAVLHSLVNVGVRVAEWARLQADAEVPDYKALLDLVDRTGLRNTTGQELQVAEDMAQRFWREVDPAARVHQRDAMDEEGGLRGGARVRR